MKRRLRSLALCAVISFTASIGVDMQEPVRAPTPAMSLGNRLLFNRMAVNPQDTLQVMLATKMAATPAVTKRVESLGGRVRYVDPDVGYVRAEIARQHFAELVGDQSILASQISSLSNLAWYDDAPLEERETMYRSYEVRGLDYLNATDLTRDVPTDLEILTVEQARGAGYTGAEEVGVEKWFADHPTYDGRGVTIAMMENAELDYTHPAFRSAKSLDGRDVPKFAGIFNPLAPDSPDRTRINMDRVVNATTTWQQIEQRTYLLPRSGIYRFGTFSIPLANSMSVGFAVLWDETSGEVWVDTNGDASFRDERPIGDFNARFETGRLQLSNPKLQLDFVVTIVKSPPAVHMYIGRGSHSTMNASVSAGSRNSDSLAFGVAPGARLLLVNSRSGENNGHDFVERYLETARRPDVDLLFDASVLETLPDTGWDFFGLIFSRIVAVRGKPIFDSAGNDPPFLNSVGDFGEDVLSVGGSIDPSAFSALIGRLQLPATTLPPYSSSGPSFDGSLKPDFLAPMHRIAAEPMSLARLSRRGLPRNSPTRWLPHGYQISCCTSSSSPYAAGVAALVLSAAKQERVPYTAAALAHALRRGAKLLPSVPLYRQGNGLINPQATWDLLKAATEPVRLRIRGPVRHALSSYFPSPAEGPGLYEREGWTKGQRGERVLRLLREMGSPALARYPLSWTGPSDMFISPASVELPLGREVEVPITIHVRDWGIHSAFLNVHHPETNTIVARAEITIVAAPQLGQNGQTKTTFETVVAPMGFNEHVVSIPPNTAAIRFDMTVTDGFAQPFLMDPTGRMPARYAHLSPQVGRPIDPGRYTLLLPHPTPGTWSVGIRNEAERRDNGPVSAKGGAYTLTATILAGSLAGELTSSGELRYRAESTGAPLAAPALEVSSGRFQRRTARHTTTGEPVVNEVDVPEGTGTLIVRARAANGASPIELHLYKCITGHCFAYDHGFPAAQEQMIRVKRPEAGRWAVAVNGAPALVGTGEFTIETLLAGRSERHNLQRSAQRWIGTIAAPALSPGMNGEGDGVLVELVDLGLEDAERQHPLANPKDLEALHNRPVAIASAILPRPSAHRISPQVARNERDLNLLKKVTRYEFR